MINIHNAGKKPIIWLTTCTRNGGITPIRSIARSQSNRCDIIHTLGGQFSLMVERDTVAACRSLARGAPASAPPINPSKRAPTRRRLRAPQAVDHRPGGRWSGRVVISTQVIKTPNPRSMLNIALDVA
jgi:hypothetical protein